jgi:hypothetical protein
MHNGNGLILPAPGEEELGRFVEVEQEEATHEHEEGKPSKGIGQISPAPIFRAAAALFASVQKASVADLKTVLAAEIGDEAPSDKAVILKSGQSSQV